MSECYGRFADLYDKLMDDVDYDRWADSVAELIRQYAGPEKGLSVLDCACGTGEISFRLAGYGYSVTGADLSEDMLRSAQEKARRHGVQIPFVRMDMRQLRLHRKVRVITCCCDGVNYLTDTKSVREFFLSAAENLEKDGLLLFDLSTPYKLEYVLGCGQMGEDREDCTYLWENLYDPESGLLEMRLHFFVPENGRSDRWIRFDETHIQRSYDTDTVKRLLEECGFTMLSATDAGTGKEPAPDCQRIQYAARRNQ